MVTVEVTGPPPTRPITEMYAWVAREPDGSEGFIASSRIIAGFFMPLMNSKRAVAEGLADHARELCRLAGKPPPYLKRFECTGVVQ